MRPNWFIGLPVDPAGWFPDRVPLAPPGTRRFPARDLHLTVAFLGAVEAEAAQAAWALCRWQGPAIPAGLGPVRGFGNPRQPSALAAVLEQGRDPVVALIAALRGPLLAAAGARPDPRPPLPHLSLARVQRRATAAQRQRALAWAASLDLGGVPLVLDRLALYTWAEDRERGLFRKVEERVFGG